MPKTYPITPKQWAKVPKALLYDHVQYLTYVGPKTPTVCKPLTGGLTRVNWSAPDPNMYFDPQYTVYKRPNKWGLLLCNMLWLVGDHIPYGKHLWPLRGSHTSRHPITRFGWWFADTLCNGYLHDTDCTFADAIDGMD